MYLLNQFFNHRERLKKLKEGTTESLSLCSLTPRTSFTLPTLLPTVCLMQSLVRIVSCSKHTQRRLYTSPTDLFPFFTSLVACVLHLNVGLARNLRLVSLPPRHPSTPILLLPHSPQPAFPPPHPTHTHSVL